MCGLTFIYDSRKTSDALEALSRNALNKLQHRGPDDSGFCTGEHWAAGHRRLAIIDISTSTQPMPDPSGRYVLVYNGEIYNYRELKSQLLDKWSFRTEGDTEVILAGLITYGESFIAKLDGMWAFALWDKMEDTLLLSRDRIGKKPLYYETTSDYFICASEIPALAQLKRNEWTEDKNSLADYFRFGFCTPGKTIYSTVKEVLPGHYLKWKKGSTAEQLPYWKLAIQSSNRSKPEAIELLRHTLTNAIRKRLVSDVEVGAFLSGGIDSSLIVSILHKDLNVNVKTFTLGFSDPSYDESKFATDVSNSLGSENYSETLKELDPQLIVQIILENFGQPYGDPSILPTALVSKLASRHVKVALSGDGGDELFGGYQRYLGFIFLKWYLRLPPPLRVVTEKFINSFPTITKHHSRSLLKKAQLFANYPKMYANKKYLAPVLFTENQINTVFPALSNKQSQLSYELDYYSKDEVLNAMYTDALIYLPQDILTKVDRASMRYSLETRCPLLDKDLIELVFSLPRPWNRDIKSGKKLLKEGFRNHLDNTVWNRNKQGFAVPIASWFKGTLGDELADLLKLENGIIEKEPVTTMLKEHGSGFKDNSFQLWLIYIYLKWKESMPVNQSFESASIPT